LDEKSVKDLAKKYNLPIEVQRIKKSAHYKPQTTHSEEYLRTIRYNFFEAVCKKSKASTIAVAHNLNDQAETVLARLLRGTGLRGMGAIKFRNNKIIRPLLNVPRKEILAYLRKNNLAFRIDKTNLGIDFTRNKIRNKLLPYIEKNFNPNIQETLFRLSQSVGADYDFIAREALRWLGKNRIPGVSALNKLSPSIRAEVLRQAIERVNPHLPQRGPFGALPIESGHVDEILKVLKSSKNKRQKISFKGLKIERIGDRLVISKT